jgi:hypothetical protein
MVDYYWHIDKRVVVNYIAGSLLTRDSLYDTNNESRLTSHVGRAQDLRDSSRVFQKRFMFWQLWLSTKT